MNKNIIIVAIIILSGLVIAAAGYFFYQKKSLEKISLQEQAGTTEGYVNTDSINNLPVTDNPSDSAIPIGASSGQPAINPGSSAENQQKDKQQEAEDRIESSAEFLDISKWKTYNNEKYGYSFKYPKEYDFSACENTSPCRYGQVYEKEGGDMAWIAGNLKNKGWPYIIVSHYNNESFTLPDNKKLLDWVKDKFNITPKTDKGTLDNYNIRNIEIPTEKGDPKKAVRIYVPQSSSQTNQNSPSFAKEEIYYNSGAKILLIQLVDPGDTQAQKIYETWLSTFVAK